MSKDAIYAKLKEILISEFEIDADSIALDKNLESDLELDSLDAIDMLTNLEDYICGEPDPALFKEVRTVEDMVNLLIPIWKKT